MFQSSPGAEPGATARTVSHPSMSHSFQSSPGAEPGATVYAVDFHPSVIQFQSSPGAEPGATPACSVVAACAVNVFQSSPGAEPGATCSSPSSTPRSRSCFNPHPALSRVPQLLRAGADPAALRVSILTRR